jgi:hypothetical protein
MSDTEEGFSPLTKLIGAAASLIAAVVTLVGVLGNKPKADDTPPQEFSGSISIRGGSGLSSVEMDLVGTPCRARTTASGYFRFTNCPEGKHLSTPRVRIFMPGQETPCLATLQAAPSASDIELDASGCGSSVTRTTPSASPPSVPPPPAPNLRYIQLGSSTTQADAETLASRQARDIGRRVCVYGSRGVFATALGPIPMAEADALIEELRGHSTVASSVYAVLGKTYVPVNMCFP